ESPLPPVYPPKPADAGTPNSSSTSAYFKIVAHDGTATYTTSAFAGMSGKAGPTAGAIRIVAINENADTNTAESALRLKPADGKPLTLLKVGDVVEAADFTRIEWNANGNNGGSFSFVPMDTSGQIIEGAAPLTYHVHESPAAPTYDASKQQVSVSYDQTQPLNRSLFAGSGREPEGVRIHAVTESQDTDSSASGLQVMRNGVAVDVNPAPGNPFIISATEFDSLRWNAASNAGGNFTFQPIDAQGFAIAGGVPMQTVTITEAAQVIPPIYPQGNQQTHTIAYADGRNSEYALDKTLFVGSTPNTTMGGILITQDPTEVNDSQPYLAGLTRWINGVGSSTARVGQGDFIPVDQLDQLLWAADQNKGGTIRFQPVDANKQPIPGVAEQSVVLTEAPAPLPAYPAGNQQNVDVTYNQRFNIDRTVLVGSASQQEPHSIRITAINNPNNAGVDSGLRKAQGAAGVKVGDTFDISTFHRLSWNGKGSTGGSFEFEALDHDGNVIGNKQTVTITEPGPVLAAVTAPQTQTVTHDGLTVLNASSFLTTDPAKSTPSNDTLQNRWFRIMDTQETSGEPGSVGTRYQAWWGGDLHAYELIKVPEGISKAEAAARAQAMGGKLWLQNANGEGGNVTDSYLRNHGHDTSNVIHDGSSDAAKLNAFVVEFDNYQLPLRMMASNSPGNTWEITPGYVAGNSTDPNGTNHIVDLDRIIWDSTRNTGGSITVQEVMGWTPWDPSDDKGGPRTRDEWLQRNPGQTPPDETQKTGTQTITINLTEAARGTVLTRSVDNTDEADAGGNAATGNDAVANGAPQASSMTAAADAAAASNHTGIVTRTAASAPVAEGAAATAEAAKEIATDNATDAAASNVLTPAELLGDHHIANAGSSVSGAASGPVDAGTRWSYTAPSLLDDDTQTPPTV
ncbi:MAG: hypothetical protein Q4D19_07905, partial [Lautropia sp.]|nr:hypothetical protein [Lautropia sp.]